MKKIPGFAAVNNNASCLFDNEMHHAWAVVGYKLQKRSLTIYKMPNHLRMIILTLDHQSKSTHPTRPTYSVIEKTQKKLTKKKKMKN